MAIKTQAEYVQSLKDGRTVYLRGERVPDVTTHPAFAPALNTVQLVYKLQEDPETAELATVFDEAIGQRISRYYAVPRSSADLLQRIELIDRTVRTACGVDTSFMKVAGSNSLNALVSVSRQVDQAAGTDYHRRVEAYRRYVAENDLTMAIAETDPKGDRSKSLQEQDPDLYLRIVERRADGIVVRGAKCSVAGAPLAHELIVMPSRSMKENEVDYSVALAIPTATPGVKVATHSHFADAEAMNEFDYPISGRYQILDSTVIFDDVFVPWDRVFLAGEWQYTRNVLVANTTFGRFGSLGARPAIAELFVGAAQLVTEYNGLDKVKGIQDKIADLIIYAETNRALMRAAALDCQIVDGVAIPNLMITNMGKYYASDRYRDVVNLLVDISGGGVLTAASGEDLHSPEIGPFMEKYYQGAATATTEQRLRAFKLAKDLSLTEMAGYLKAYTLHAQGSPSIQVFAIQREYDFSRAKALAKRAAGITD